MSETSKLSKSFVDNAKDLNLDQATELLVEAEKKLRQIKEERAADEKLNAAKAIAKDLSAGYTSAAAYEKAKIQFLLDKIHEIEEGQVNPTSGLNK
jgi:membrane protein involved in colicin uptake